LLLVRWISFGYLLSLAGTAIIYLVRPYRQEQLVSPQVLYSYDDNSLKTYADYEVLSNPAQLAGTSFDFVLITLDGAALRAEAGEQLVDAIGRASGSTFRDHLGLRYRNGFAQFESLSTLEN
jgi:hypothetical protein